MKNDFLQQALCSSVLAIALVATPAFATTVTYSTDFETPIFSPGPVQPPGSDPRYTAGQDGWGGYNAGEISTDQAHSGTQSIKTTYASNGSGPQHLLDPDTPGDPNHWFDISYSNDWWVQAWVRPTAGGQGVTISVNSPILISISGAGVPYYHSGYRDAFGPNLGAGAFDQWLLLRMVHTASMGAALNFYIIGANVNQTMQLEVYGPTLPNVVTLFGDAYWDDFSAGYGDAPPPVPLPASAWLMLSGLGGLGALSRKRKG